MTKLKRSRADVSAMMCNTVSVKQYGNRMVATRVVWRRKSKSPKRKAANDRFRQAASYAKHILKMPGMKERYAKGITDLKRSAYAVALADFLNAPKIHYVTTKEYAGAVGDIIRIKATDDFRVEKVTVKILDKQGNLLEEGSAERYPRRPAMWIYRATVKNKNPKGTTIRVKAMDMPENRAVCEMVVE